MNEKSALKRILSFVLCMVLLIAAVPAFSIPVFATTEFAGATGTEDDTVAYSGTSGSNINWIIDNEGNMIITGTGAASAISYSGSDGLTWDDIKKKVISVRIEEGITSLAESMFEDCSMIESVELPKSLTSIEKRAFWGCSRLSDINLPQGITEISNSVFYECWSLKEIVLPNGVKSIGEMAFAHCRELSDITIPESVMEIEYYAFGNCGNLESVNIPSNIEKLDSGAFQSPTKLFINANSKAASCLAYRESGDTISGEFYSPSAPEYEIHKVERDDGSYYLSISDYLGAETRIELPTMIDGLQVLKVEGYAFQKAQQLTEVVIPDGYEEIGYLAFYTNEAIKKVYVPTTATDIKNTAFDDKPIIQCHKGSYTEQWALENGCIVEYVDDLESKYYAHTMNSVRENEIESTCIKGGKYDSVIYCSVCEKEISRETKTTESTGHTEVIDKTVTPTCTETGLTEGSHCSTCNTTLIPQQIIVAKGHAFVDGACKYCGVFEGLWISKSTDGNWYSYQDGKRVDYTGFADNEYGTWYVENGQVTFNKNDVIKDNVDGTWKYVKDSKFTEIDTVAKNANGWWYCKNGQVQFGYTGIQKNDLGWWRIVGGKVDFSATGVYQNELGWWYCKDGKVQFNYTGIKNNANGWWRIENGKVNFSANGVFQNELGWWKVENGKVNFNFTGIAANSNGKWYCKNGKVDFSKNGKVTYGGTTYTVKGGKVV